jgi:hypothetical protein
VPKLTITSPVRRLVNLTNLALQESLSSSQFANVTLRVGMLRTNSWFGFTCVVKTFAKDFTTGHLQTLFSSIFYVQEALRHGALVAPIGCALIDVDGTSRPSFVYPHIPGKPLSKMLNGTHQLIFHQKQFIIIGVLHAMLFPDSIRSFHGRLNTDNLVVDLKLRPRLISCGLTRIATTGGVARGDPEFQAPEIFDGSGPNTRPMFSRSVCFSKSSFRILSPPRRLESLKRPIFASRTILKLDRRSQNLQRMSPGSVL